MKPKMNIPWASPDIQQTDIQALQRVIHSGWLSMGNEVKQFEKKTASYLDIKYAIAVNTGTAALDTALKCLNIKKGDEVLIPALTYIASGNVVLYNHATPVFVDIDHSLNINPSLIEERITKNTKAIINVDLGGNVSNYDELQRISQNHDIALIVDGAQSLGAEYKGRKCCTHGLINTTSFHAAKMITTIEGGMVFTNQKALYQKAQAIRTQGETSKYIHNYLGNNYRMTDLMAAIGTSQIERIETKIQQRKTKVKYYKDNLEQVEYPQELPNTVNSNFLFIILVNDRDKLMNHLHKKGIDTRITYPMPINEQPIFQQYSNEVFPVAREMSQRVLSLPLYQALTGEEQAYIVQEINAFRR